MILNKIKINDTDTVTPSVVYDISKATGQSYETLSDALSGNNVPLEIREGGMSVRFVTSDNKYLQYRLMSDTFNTNAANWQGVDDKPTAGSDNLVKSGGVYGELRVIKDKLGGVDLRPIEFVQHTHVFTGGNSLRNDGTNITQETTGANVQSAAIQVAPGDEFLLNNIGSGFNYTAYLFAKSDFSVIQDSRSENNHTCKEEVITAPAEAAWLVLNNNGDENPCYHGGSIISDTDKKIAIEKSRAEAAETNLQRNIDANAKRNVDNLSGIVLGGAIELTRGYYLDTSGSSIPTNEGEVVPTARGDNSYAIVAVQPGDVFTLNSKGGNSHYRAYAWVKSDFSIITPKVASDYNCVYDVVTAPAEAAYLVVNNSVRNAPDSYYGTNFKNYVDRRVSVASDSSAETHTISVGEQTYGVSSADASKRLLSSVVIATATANVSTTGTSTQNIINGNYSVKKGSKLRITVSGLITYVRNLDLYVNGVFAARISEPIFVYTCDSDVTVIRILARVANVVTDGSVSATVELLSIYNAIGDVNDRTLLIDNLVYKSDSADVYGNTLLYPKWHNVFLINNGAQEYASSTYITSEFIPVDTLAFLRVSCSYDFSVFRYDKDKNRLSTTDYTGDSVFAFNSKIGSSNTKYIRLRMNTGNPEDVVISCDSLVSRFNNKRLLDNKNVKCFGHRGSSLRSDISAADNYPSSIWGAYINGFDGVHFNVQFTTDHVPYCLHDPTFVDDASGNTITLNNCTSAELEGYTRDGQPIAKVESGIYMAKMMGLDVIIYNPYGTVVAEDYDALVNLVKKYDMFEHTWFGVPGRPGSPNTTYLNKIVAAYPKANVMRTEADITSAEYSSITALIADAESMLQSYPNLNIALWINSGAHPEQHFIDANMDKPWNVRLAVHGLATDKYAAIMPYISFYTAQIGAWSFGAVRRDVEKIVTDKYPEFLLGDYGNVI